jgi:hypothetical protein
MEIFEITTMVFLVILGLISFTFLTVISLIFAGCWLENC